MRLTEIDGDLLVSESLLPELEPDPQPAPEEPAYTAVTVGGEVVGALLGFSFTSTTLDVTCATVGSPLRLLEIPTGLALGIVGVELRKNYNVREITCDIEGKTCSLKSILKFA